MVVGAADTGKSTFAHWLFERLSALSQGALAFLDGDPGQSTLGPPTTVTLLVRQSGDAGFLWSGRRWRRFVGSTTPRNHEIALLTSVGRLTEVARSRKTHVTIYDTSGLIDPNQGGIELKLAKIDLLRPDTVVAIRLRHELDPLLGSLRRSKRSHLVELSATETTRRQSSVSRRNYRARRFAEHLAGAAVLPVDLGKMAVFPDTLPRQHQLVSFEDTAGFTRALGITMRMDESSGVAHILTPLRDPARIDSIRLARLAVDPETFLHQLL